MPLAISKVLPVSPVHLLPMSLVYTPLASGGLSSYLSSCCLSRPQRQNLSNGAPVAPFTACRRRWREIRFARRVFKKY